MTPYTIGEPGGVETVKLTNVDIPSHSHTIQVYSSDADSAIPTGAVLASDPKLFAPADATLDQTLNSNVVSPFPGGSVAHTNLMPYLTLNWIIALQGIFPSRP